MEWVLDVYKPSPPRDSDLKEWKENPGKYSV
jgi:hypothetical protein